MFEVESFLVDFHFTLIDSLCHRSIFQFSDVVLDGYLVVIVEFAFLGDRGVIFWHELLHIGDSLSALIYSIDIGVYDLVEHINFVALVECGI